MVRSLLYEAANGMLTVVRKAHPLKDWARRIRRRSGHKKACVALARKLAGRVRAALEDRPELRATIEPLLSTVATLKREIARLDAAVMARAKAAPACRVLMSVPGIGPVTALAYAATIDDPDRFAKSRAVGAYLGLTTRRFQSGRWTTRGAYPSTATPWCAACSTRPPTPC